LKVSGGSTKYEDINISSMTRSSRTGTEVALLLHVQHTISMRKARISV
jgi:hypothetical protein